ncbi:MepB family protein [Nocardia sp. NPDC055053]
MTEASRLYNLLGLEFSAPVPETENAEYGAFVSHVGGRSVRFRVGRVTPAKVGLFVAVWHRAGDDSTEPFASEDAVDLLVITVREHRDSGQFVFPKRALVEHGIVSVGGRGGKRGFRVYPPWSATANKQAMRSQSWQCDYFLDLGEGREVDLDRALRLYTS